MKIISNFQDVYDQCAMYGIDEDTRYRRFIEVNRVKFEEGYSVMERHLSSARVHSHWFEDQINFFSGASFKNKKLDRYDIGTTSIMFLVVGEHVIPHVGGLQIRYKKEGASDGNSFYSSWMSSSDVERVDQAEDIISPLHRAFSSYQDMVTSLGLSLEKRRFAAEKSASDDDRLVDFSHRMLLDDDVLSTEELMTPFRDERWARAIGAPLAVVMPAVVGRKSAMRKDLPPTDIKGALVIRNPSIKHLGLASLMDPFTIHQEISMALNGFMSSQDDGADRISDKDRAKAKGFDDISFKTRKGTKKPRRKKVRGNA